MCVCGLKYTTKGSDDWQKCIQKIREKADQRADQQKKEMRRKQLDGRNLIINTAQNYKRLKITLRNLIKYILNEQHTK